MTDQAPAVTGKPLRWLQLDGLVLLARYGLNYDVSFQHTHLGGPAPADPP